MPTFALSQGPDGRLLKDAAHADEPGLCYIVLGFRAHWDERHRLWLDGSHVPSEEGCSQGHGPRFSQPPVWMDWNYGGGSGNFNDEYSQFRQNDPQAERQDTGNPFRNKVMLMDEEHHWVALEA